MISTDQLNNLMDADVVGSDGDKLGGVGQVYLDDDSGQPAWVTVKTGFFGTNENFVPLADASLEGDTIRVPYTKDRVKDAPNMAPDGSLSREQEAELYAYYGVGGYTSTTTDYVDTTGTDYVDTTTTTTGYTDTARSDVAYDTSGPETDEAMTRSEERLDVDVQRAEAGRARLRKYVVTEQQTVTVPVQREEVRLEREAITDANVGDALEGPDISEEEAEITLYEERAVVSTEAVPVERVRLEKETVTEQETVTGEVRKEQIELEQGGRTTTYGDTVRSDVDTDTVRTDVDSDQTR